VDKEKRIYPQITRNKSKKKKRSCDCGLRPAHQNLMILVKFPDGSVEVLEDAVRVDTQNFHEGMYDFYDIRGNLLKQIDMGSGVTWESVDVSEDSDNDGG
jgi:predicted secreted Zn-dependent protease